MAYQPLLSIVIPALNEEHYIPKLLTDIKNQQEKNFEIIVVDGGSKDKTVEKVKRFEKDFPLHVIQIEKENVSFSRNRGADKSHGRYLVFIDADAQITPTFTAQLATAIEKTSALLLLPHMLPDTKSKKDKIMFSLINKVIDASHAMGKPLSSGGSIFIEKNLFGQLKGFDERLYMSEDHNLIHRAHKMGVKAKILKDVKVVFSLRRVEREGQFAVAYKYLLALLFVMLRADVTKKIFPYEMGGQAPELRHPTKHDRISKPRSSN